MNWQDVLTDKSLQNLPYKIELGKTGRIEMSPATNWHAYWQYEIAGILREQLRAKGILKNAKATSKSVWELS